MNPTPTGPITTDVLEVPGARLYYEVRGSGPLVVLVGAPMDARSFASLAELLAVDHTVLTTDPRGINRSSVEDRERDSTPELRADDLSRLIQHIDAGPADVLGSSGGAVSALALAQVHPEQVRTLVAHEPPLQRLLDDREKLESSTDDMIAAYLAGDVRSAWLVFFAMSGMNLPEPVMEQIINAERDEQAIADDDYQYQRMLRPTTRWEPDTEKLRRSGTRIVVGIGQDSAGQYTERASRVLAHRIEIEPTTFPGGHIAFAQDPAPFAVRLRQVLEDG